MGNIVDYAGIVDIESILEIVQNLPNDGSLTNLALIKAIVDNLPNDGSLNNLAAIRNLLNVPEVDNIDNDTINEILGNKSDSNDANTLYGFSRDAHEENHSAQLVYPTLADGVLVTSHADAWTLGNYAEIVPVNTITDEFHIHHICICAASANAHYEAVLYQATTEIARMSFSRTDKKDDVEGIPLYAPHCSANSQIQAKLASSQAASEDTVRIVIWYHLHT